MKKISIKREQSQAGLSFAERENRRSLAGGESNFRPQVKNKLLLLLALLLTAATGAWATDVDVYVVGNGTGNWVNGVAWDPGASDNKMTEQNGVYSITFKDVDANSELLFKFAINGTWAVNYGCTSWDANELNKTLSNIDATGGANFKFGLTEKADVTISFNLSEMTYMISTKGMKVGDDAATGYTVSMKDGVKDADKWTVKVGEGQAQALPIGGLTGDGKETVTLQYTGRLKVKGVKATSDEEPAAVPVTAITLNKTATTITAGQTETLSVSSVTPDDATDQTVTWSSDNEAVATVDADGKVTAVALGTANITATANDGSGVTATCAVTVNKVVTINQSDWGNAYRSFTKDGVTVSAGMIDSEDGNLMDGGSFSTTLGNFTKIVVTATSCYASGTGWSGSRSSMTWEGTPASTVSFSGEFMGMGRTQTTIVCTIVPKN
jgi:uncharacterized protein YjdB